MLIKDMHIWFRQYAQQMGMQNVRAILPEQIDTFINTSIPDTIAEVIKGSVDATNDRIITDNAKLASINALRTLYKVKEVTIGGKKVSAYKFNPFTFDSTVVDNPLYFVDFNIRYSNINLQLYYSQISTAKLVLAAITDKGLSDADYLNLLDNEDFLNSKTVVSSYKAFLQSLHREVPDEVNTVAEFKTLVNDVEDAYSSTVEYTRWFPIRIIDDSYLADVLNDYVLAPRMRSPIMVVYGVQDNKDDSRFDVYVGENQTADIRTIADKKYIADIRCSYIKIPNKVKYVSDITGNEEDDVHCDLPEQLQIPMLKHAVDLYRISIAGSLMTANANARQNQQEEVRNNRRPYNEGYQS